MIKQVLTQIFKTILYINNYHQCAIIFNNINQKTLNEFCFPGTKKRTLSLRLRAIVFVHLFNNKFFPASHRAWEQVLCIIP